jgi:hypothetical protein
MDSFYKTLSNRMDKHIPKLTISTLSCDIQYDYTQFYKSYLNEKPDDTLIVKLNQYFKCADFSKFKQE